MAYYANAAIYALVYKIILDGILIFMLNLKVSGFVPKFRFSSEPIKKHLIIRFFNSYTVQSIISQEIWII